MNSENTIAIRLSFLISALLLSSLLFGQLRTDLSPYPLSDLSDIEAVQVDFVMPYEADIPKDDLSPPRIGTATPVTISTDDKGSWIILPAVGLKIWTIKLLAAENDGISVYFDAFNPGKEGRLFVFDDMGNSYGAFTQYSNPKGGAFAIHPIRTKELVLQFETAINASDYNLQINEIGLLYPGKGSLGFGTSGPCQVNVNCSEGHNYVHQKRGVVRIIVKQGSAQFYCSGSLINNTLADRMPYLLTANHCGQNSSTSDYEQWLFTFNYESDDCDKPSEEPFLQTMSGAELISRAVDGTINGSDFKLLKLLQDVPKTYNPYYNGWSRDEDGAESGASIHHPDGDIKKISSFTVPTASAHYGHGNNAPDGMYWRVRWAATENGHGVTEGGSSGSPLFDEEGRIIGLLTGGSSSCVQLDSPDFYGKFSSAWDANGINPINQLRPWLDPLGLNPLTLSGLGADTMFVEADFSVDRREISINQFVKFENNSRGPVEQFEWNFPGGSPSTSTEKEPPLISYGQYGDFEVKLIVHGTDDSDTLVRTNYIGVKPYVYPNPGQNRFTLSFGVDITEDVEVAVFDAMGRETACRISRQGSKLSFELDNPVSGTYIIRVTDKLVEKNLKLLVVY